MGWNAKPKRPLSHLAAMSLPERAALTAREAVAFLVIDTVTISHWMLLLEDRTPYEALCVMLERQGVVVPPPPCSVLVSAIPAG